MKTFSFVQETSWLCATCNLALQPKKVKVEYLHSSFTVELMACPKCDFIYVPEDLATGKMFEVEQLLEDK